MLPTIKFHHQYFPFSEATTENFFRDAISNSSIYRRSAGYFSSSVLHLFKLEYLDFAQKGGKIDLICSNQLAIEDVNILTADSDEPHYAIIRQINELDISGQSIDPLDFFSALIRADVLNIKIAQYKNGGMFHDKTG